MEFKEFDRTLKEQLQDKTGDTKIYRENVLDNCYCELFDYIVTGLDSGYNKDLILKLSKEKLLQTKYILDNYC